MKMKSLCLTTLLLGLAGSAFAQDPATSAGAPSTSAPVSAAARAADDDVADLRINFRNAPLEMVLNYLSEAAGFTIMLETPVKGTIDVWSNQPVTRKEAVEILDSALNKNGYAAIRNGRTLTIVSREDAKTRNIPIVSSENWEDIPQTDTIATYIVPVLYISATDLITSLGPLVPATMQISANQNSNSLIITDTQASIRRIAHITSLLDSSVSSVSTLRIIPLKHSDAKDLAATINQLYSSGDTGNNRSTTRGAGFTFPGFGGNRGGNDDNNNGQ